MEFNARRYDNNEPVRIRIEGERIAAVTPLQDDGSFAALPIVAPAFYDLQINGHGGIWFGQSDLTPEKVLSVLKPHFSFGVTRMFPTLITNSNENLLHGFEQIRKACEQEKMGRPTGGRMSSGRAVSLGRGRSTRALIRKSTYDLPTGMSFRVGRRRVVDVSVW